MKNENTLRLKQDYFDSVRTASGHFVKVKVVDAGTKIHADRIYNSQGVLYANFKTLEKSPRIVILKLSEVNEYIA